jgi:hypothetical protein
MYAVFFLGIKSAFVSAELLLGNLTLSRWAALLYIYLYIYYINERLYTKKLPEIEVFMQKNE